MSFKTFWYAGCERSDAWKPSLDIASAGGAAGDFRSVPPHLDLPIAGLRPLSGGLERHVEVGGLDDPEVGEVLLVSNVDGSWPYGWNRSVV
jgi:hypothetical protein